MICCRKKVSNEEVIMFFSGLFLKSGSPSLTGLFSKLCYFFLRSLLFCKSSIWNIFVSSPHKSFPWSPSLQKCRPQTHKCGFCLSWCISALYSFLIRFPIGWLILQSSDGELSSDRGQASSELRLNIQLPESRMCLWFLPLLCLWHFNWPPSPTRVFLWSNFRRSLSSPLPSPAPQHAGMMV